MHERTLLIRWGNVSDAGMADSLVTGDSYPTPAKLNRFLGR